MRFLALLVLLLVGLAAPAMAQTETERDRGFLQALLEDNLSAAGRDVRIEGFAGALSSRATFSELTIADDEGVWLTIRNGAIAWNRGALVAGRIEIAELAAEEIDLARLPAAEAVPQPEAVPFSLPELPVSLNIGAISAPRVTLGAPVLGAAVALRLDGAISLANGEGSARLTATRIDGALGTVSLQASFANATREVLLDLLLDEGAGGIVATLLHLPDRPALQFALAGAGPLENFSADLVLRADRAQRLAGQITLARAESGEQRFAASLGGNVVPLLPPEYRSFFGADARLAAEGKRQADGGLSLDVFSLSSAALALEGSLILQASGLPDQAALTLSLGLPDVARVTLPLGGGITSVANGTLTLGYDRSKSETWNVAGRLNGLQQGALSIGRLDLNGSGRVASGALPEIAGAFNFAAANIGGVEPALAPLLAAGLRGQVQFGWRQGAPVTMPLISLNAAGAALSGAAEISGTGLGTRVSGAARISHPDLAQFAALAGIALGGRFEGVVEGWYEPLGGGLFAETALLAINLKTGQPLLDPLLAGGSRLRLIAERDAGGLKLALDSSAAGFNAEAEALLQTGATSATAHISLPDLGLLGKGRAGAVTANAQLSGAPGARVLVIDASGNGLATGVAALDPLLAGAATLQLAAGEEMAAWRLQRVDLATPEFSAGLGAADGEGRHPVSLSLVDLAQLAPGFSGPATASGQVKLAPDQIELSLDAAGPAGSKATVAGLVARDFSNADLALTGRADAALLNRLLAPRSLSGVTGLDLRLQGVPGLAALSGRISGQGLVLTDPGLGVTVQQIALTADLSGGRATVSSSGSVGGGMVRASGPVSLRAPYAADLALSLQDVALRDATLYETRVSGALGISGGLARGALISGALTLGLTELRVPEGSAALALPELRHIGAPADVTATRRSAGLLTAAGASRAGVAYALDISVSAPRRIFVRGRGLDAELGGALRLGGTTAAVLTSGQFDLIRGRLDVLGKRFTLTEGQVSLQGALTPWLRFAATTQTADIAATITIEGDASAPELRLSSVPDLPQDEVLARLLFARGIERLSPLQAAQMAQAVAQLAGRGGEGMLGRLRAAFGLDDLDLATSAEGETTLKIGKYLSDNVYTDVTLGNGGKAEINLNLDIRPGLIARGTLGADGTSGIGIYYERDY